MSIQARATQYGKLFGNWKIREFIGEGSHGKTGVFRIIKNYEGFQDENALKVVTVLREDGWPEELTEEARRKYEANKAALCTQAVNEVKLMNRLAGDPYVVSYQNWEFCDWEESGQFGCDLLIQMPMLVTLKRLQNTGEYFSGEEIRRVGRDICKALIRCGEEGILHRDIKPANIFLPSNRKGNYMLGDFGISRIVESGLGGASTSVGTLDYAAPEQFGSGYDSRVDIYSLGLTLYELANQNHLPFWMPGRSSADAVKQRLGGSVLPPPSHADPELAHIILKACAFRPEDRYQTAAEFLAALDGAQSQTPPQPKPKPEPDPIPIPPDPVPPTTVKNPKFTIAGVCLAAVLVVAIVAATLHGGSNPTQSNDAIQTPGNSNPATGDIYEPKEQSEKETSISADETIDQANQQNEENSSSEDSSSNTEMLSAIYGTGVAEYYKLLTANASNLTSGQYKKLENLSAEELPKDAVDLHSLQRDQIWNNLLVPLTADDSHDVTLYGVVDAGWLSEVTQQGSEVIDNVQRMAEPVVVLRCGDDVVVQDGLSWSSNAWFEESPLLIIGDFDGDKEDEVAVSTHPYHGTGTYHHQLWIYDIGEKKSYIPDVTNLDVTAEVNWDSGEITLTGGPYAATTTVYDFIREDESMHLLCYGEIMEFSMGYIGTSREGLLCNTALGWGSWCDWPCASVVVPVIYSDGEYKLGEVTEMTV